MTKLFFFVSGEHRTLPFAEIKAILESEGLSFKHIVTYPRVLCLDSTIEGALIVGRRSSMTKIAGLEIFQSSIDSEEIFQNVKQILYRKYIEKKQSFCVRMKSVISSDINTVKFEKKIGQIILEKVKHSKVDLDNPDVCFFGVMTDSVLIFGIKLIETQYKRFIKREPSKRPFFYPTTMSPKLARCMVNLARARSGSLVLDPFCGVGAILIEAGDMGYRVLGSDIKAKMVKGCLINLRYFKVPFVGLSVADARKLPFKNIDCIISNPPYGRASSTLGLSTKELVSDFLTKVFNFLSKGNHLSLALPDNLNWKEVIMDRGYQFVEEHIVREHKSLTRKIFIIKKP